MVASSAAITAEVTRPRPGRGAFSESRCARRLTGKEAMATKAGSGRDVSSGPCPEARSSSLNSASHPRKNPEVTRRWSARNASGMTGRTASSGTNAARRGRPGRRRRATKRTYDMAAATAATTANRLRRSPPAIIGVRSMGRDGKNRLARDGELLNLPINSSSFL
ncbi:Os04g0481850 [Oryza sativa Japonica Group]|uniref:Os04g0481850 protein n=1 Tax=Oryza sativa subsp. japonica TaxID=39947 RepID=A0A0P0WBT5_ORYSJ|nr:Os04g0481850 [Oryza sativa Japonica Group]